KKRDYHRQLFGWFSIVDEALVAAWLSRRERGCRRGHPSMLRQLFHPSSSTCRESVKDRMLMWVRTKTVSTSGRMLRQRKGGIAQTRLPSSTCIQIDSLAKLGQCPQVLQSRSAHATKAGPRFSTSPATLPFSIHPRFEKR